MDMSCLKVQPHACKSDLCKTLQKQMWFFTDLCKLWKTQNWVSWILITWILSSSLIGCKILHQFSDWSIFIFQVASSKLFSSGIRELKMTKLWVCKLLAGRLTKFFSNFLFSSLPFVLEICPSHFSVSHLSKLFRTSSKVKIQQGKLRQSPRPNWSPKLFLRSCSLLLCPRWACPQFWRAWMIRLVPT